MHTLQYDTLLQKTANGCLYHGDPYTMVHLSCKIWRFGTLFFFFFRHKSGHPNDGEKYLGLATLTMVVMVMKKKTFPQLFPLPLNTVTCQRGGHSSHSRWATTTTLQI